MKTTILPIVLLLFGTAYSQPSITTRFPVKWKTEIGVTTYRTNMLFHNGLLYIGSNGESREGINDKLDGVHAIDPKTGKVKATYQLPFAGDDDVTGIAIGGGKLFFGTDNYYFFCFDLKSGKELWKQLLNYDVESTPVIEDFNGDGMFDVAFPVQNHGFYALNGKDGSPIWSQELISSNNGNPAPVLIDVNEDGTRDIVYSGTSYSEAEVAGTYLSSYGDYHFAMDGTSGEILWLTPASSNSNSSPFLFDENGEKRIALLDRSGNFQIVDRHGNVRSTAKLRPELSSTPVMTKDKHLIVGTFSLNYTADQLTTNEDGIPELSEETEFLEVKLREYERISATTMVADVLGTGTMQGIGVTEEGMLFLMQTNGKEIAQLKLEGKGAEASPFIADIDGDGQLEILIADLDGFLYCYGTQSKGKVEVGAFR